MAIDLRSAQPTDSGRAAGILSTFIDQTPWLPRVHSRAQDIHFVGELIDRGWVTVALEDERLVGFSARNDEVVHALYVAEAARRRGVGTALLVQMKADQTGLSLWTFQANAGAQAFYLRHGFREKTRTDGAGNDEGLPDIQYVWSREQQV